MFTACLLVLISHEVGGQTALVAVGRAACTACMCQTLGDQHERRMRRPRFGSLLSSDQVRAGGDLRNEPLQAQPGGRSVLVAFDSEQQSHQADQRGKSKPTEHIHGVVGYC